MLRIRELRERAGLSQLALARRVGVPPAALCRWERNQIDPRASILPRIAAALGVRVDELFETVEGEVVETRPVIGRAAEVVGPYEREGGRP